MAFDNSRYTFNPWKDYSGVVMQQGRVQLDSDWNEWLAELSRRIQAGTLDILGRAVYPATTPSAFQIVAQTAGDGSNHILIGPGRMYVDGILAENHGTPTTSWDPALAELSNSPQPAPQPPPTPPAPGSIEFSQQPYLPNAAINGNGPFLAYLDVWTRPVTYLEDTNLIDKAVGVDTTGRLQTVWQVKLMAVPSGTTCASPITWPTVSAGLLTTGVAASAPGGPCCLTSSTGYTGQENQFYRVEIHRPGTPAASPAPMPLPSGAATFKWSRDNGSVMTGVTAIAGATNSAGDPASSLTVLSLGRDQVLGFSNGDWIELLDDSTELNGEPGYLYQIDTVDFAAKTITLVTTVSGSFSFNASFNPRIIRWDQSGKVYLQDGTTVWWDLGATGSTGDIPVPPSGTVLVLENGITVAFDENPSGGSFVAGDFWTFAARTADGSVEELSKAPPRGIHHHYAPLSIVAFNPNSNTDCRTPWSPSAGAECGCCCTYTVGQGGQYSSINAAIQALPTSGGEVCILPGIYYENVFIEDRNDVVLRGCGWQTRIASASLNPNPPGSTTQSPAAQTSGSSGTTFTAVITVSGCRHVELKSFAVEADKEDIGVLLDGTGNLSTTLGTDSFNTQTRAPGNAIDYEPMGVIDTTLEDLVITASDLPAILGQKTILLAIDKNRIAMQNVRSTWPAVQVSGSEIRITHNWVGLLGTAAAVEWIPASVRSDLQNQASAASGQSETTDAKADFNVGAIDYLAKMPLNPGGIQIAGPSTNVFVLENEIQSTALNGITLGSYSILDANGNDTGIVVGVLTQETDACSRTGSLTPGGVPPSAPQGSTVVAGGKLTNVQIDRNFIHNTGLCGIGPVGFFDLKEILEVISVENLTIACNTIADALQANLADIARETTITGYGAICLPDVQTVTIRDNMITNFGATPGLRVCGIYLLLGEMVDISRNQILETRDWSTSGNATGTVIFGRGGISALVTPPTYTVATAYARGSFPVWEPSLPALRVEHNVVRVPLSTSLAVLGFGPFTIVNNHFACGGNVTDTGTPLAQTVLILNLGTALESNSATNSFSAVYTNAAGAANLQTQDQLGSLSGAVTFTDNVCQLEGQNTNQRAFSNVLILTLDSLNFASNHCWVDGPGVIDSSGNVNLKDITAFLDVMLLAGSLQTTNNRFQEAPLYPVLASGLTYGVMNITTQNIATYCLYAEASTASWLFKANNLIVAPALCRDALKG